MGSDLLDGIGPDDDSQSIRSAGSLPSAIERLFRRRFSNIFKLSALSSLALDYFGRVATLLAFFFIFVLSL